MECVIIISGDISLFTKVKKYFQNASDGGGRCGFILKAQNAETFDK